MIIIFLAAGLALFALAEHMLRRSAKRRAAAMTDAELKNEIYMGGKFGCTVDIYCEELERREVSAMMMARVL